MVQFSSLFNGFAKTISKKSGRKSREDVGREAANALAKEARKNELILTTSGCVNAISSHNFASLHSRQGKKGVNQDRAVVWEEFGGQEDMIFCGVFDGHGPWGHLVAKRVRELVPSSLLCNWQKALAHNMDNINIGLDDSQLDVWKQSHIKACSAVDQQLKQQADSFYSGTTALTVVKQGDVMVVANVGDSRAVLATADDDGKLVAVQLTVDLKPNLPGERERIMRSKGRVWSSDDEPGVYRVWMPNSDGGGAVEGPGLAVSRAFGDHYIKDFGLISEPQLTFRNITFRDQFAILATDGVGVLANRVFDKLLVFVFVSDRHDVRRPPPPPLSPHYLPRRGLIKINGVPIELIQPEILRSGGGHTSQIYAIRQSIAKALVAFYQKYVDEQSKKEIKDILVRYDRTLLVADPRRCEPKKFGGRGARARCHEGMSTRMIDHIVDEHHIDIDSETIKRVKEFILASSKYALPKTSGEKLFLYDIVANGRNGIDVDKFDYIVRDSRACGLGCNFQFQRLMETMRVLGDEICYRAKDYLTVHKLFATRADLYRTVYTHAKVKAIELMVVEALVKANGYLHIASYIQDPSEYWKLDDSIIKTIETAPEKPLCHCVATTTWKGKGLVVETGRSKFEKFVRNVETVQNVKSELDTYLQDGVFICEGDSTKFNALDWWKSNNLKFRVLSKMACEILSIPITTVASESTFSAGGRVIDTYRASLGTNTVQMLLCGSDWLRNLYNLKRKVKCTEDVKTISLE